MPAYHHEHALEIRFHAAQSLLHEAAALALSIQSAPGGPSTSLKGRQDYLTEADRAIENLIAEKLHTLFPEDGFLGEEQGEQNQGFFQWVLDPIDGTSNYARGRSRWCLSLALLKEKKPVLGLIHAPALGEYFTAQHGKGAFLNGRPIQAALTKQMDKAMIELGWSSHVPLSWFQEKMTSLLSLGAMPRSLGSGALALADVACGRSDAYLEKVIYIWDVAAALVLLHEAGAKVSPFMTMGGMTQATSILASAPGIAPTLSQAFNIPLQ